MSRQNIYWPIALLCMCVATFFACRKTDHLTAVEINTNIVEQFLELPANSPKQIEIVANSIRKRNEETGFLYSFIKRHGLPVWRKSLVSTSPIFADARGAAPNGLPEDWILIPLVRENEQQVTAALACILRADTLYSIKLLDGKDYASYRQTEYGEGLNSAQLSLMLMLLDKAVFGHENFKITDSLAFAGAADKQVLTVKVPDSLTAAKILQATFTICVTITVPRAEGQLTGCPGNTPDCPPYVEQTTCQTYYFWGQTEGGGSGGSSGGGNGGTGGSWPPSGGGNGGSEGSGGTGWQPITLDPDESGPPLFPCVQAALADSVAGALLKPVIVRNKLTTINSSLATDTSEKSFSFGWDSTGTIQATPISSGGATTAPIFVTYSGLTITAGVHTHPSAGYANFSAGDVYAIAQGNAANKYFRTLYVVSPSGTMYALSVYDATKLAVFLSNYPKSTYFDPATNGWKRDEDIGWYYNLAKIDFIKQGLSDDEAEEGAMSFVIGKYNMGLAVARQNTATGKFEGLYVDAVPTNLVNNPIRVTKTKICNYR